MYQCPRCKSDRIHFSRTRSKWEGWRKQITGKRPYRCPDCLWRGWDPDPRPGFTSGEFAAASRAIGPNATRSMLVGDERRATNVDLRQIDQAFHGVRNTVRD